MFSAESITIPNACTATFQNMFKGCNSLQQSADIGIKTLKGGYMFTGMYYGCTVLDTVYSHIETVSGTSQFTDWLANVASEGTFYNYGGYAFPAGASGIPNGWTVETE
jgi:hypothetical protein